MAQTLTGISSMATKVLLQEMADDYRKTTGITVTIESAGGLDVAKRVQAGEPFDLVFLAADAIDRLIAAQSVVAGSRVDVVRSGVYVAVRKDAPRPLIDSEDALRDAVRAAKTIGYSTGPSGVALQKLFARWGITDEIKDRIVQAQPGVPVGKLIAEGAVELGFQQRSELIHLPGIDVVGPLPSAIQITTTFSGGVTSASRDRAAAAEVLGYMGSDGARAAIIRQGMEPVSG
jgi:molybdate transport system substrate-binding protein